MGFKEAVANDIKQVFINLLEFADPHDVDGNIINVVVDSDVIKERNLRSYAEFAEGIFVELLTVYAAVADIPNRPVKDQVMRLDGELYIVCECDEDMGVLTILLQANDT